VFRTDALRVNRSLRRQLASKPWRLTVDHAFEQVIRACAAPRTNEAGTWIVPAMIDAYVKLHRQGHAHSVEVWEGEQLVGGIYGVAVGRLFCGESMFSAQSGGSKIALIALAQLLRSLEFPLIDAQVANAHTIGLGATEISRSEFLRHASRLVRLPSSAGSWSGLTAQLLQPS
jgi:leucyl/phenylalanyl-tRNA--protein transferase